MSLVRFYARRCDVCGKVSDPLGASAAQGMRLAKAGGFEHNHLVGYQDLGLSKPSAVKLDVCLGCRVRSDNIRVWIEQRNSISRHFPIIPIEQYA